MGEKRARSEVVLIEEDSTSNADASGMELEIDEALLAAAVASVERGGRRPTPDTAALEERIRVQSEQLSHLHAELKRAEAARVEAEEQSRAVMQQLRDRAIEVEQLRNRIRRERDEAERGTEEKLLRGLLDIYDNLDRAWFHAMSDPEQVLAGLQMIHDQFSNWLRRAGAERVVAPEGRFDPSVHEAVMYRPSPDALPGQVVEEVSAGFRYRGRLLRPARVVVSSP